MWSEYCLLICCPLDSLDRKQCAAGSTGQFMRARWARPVWWRRYAIGRSQQWHIPDTGGRTVHTFSWTHRAQQSAWKIEARCSKLCIVVALDFLPLTPGRQILDREKWVGLSSTVLRWFRSSLLGGGYVVSIADHSFEQATMPCGVPQGSIWFSDHFYLIRTCFHWDRSFSTLMLPVRFS